MDAPMNPSPNATGRHVIHDFAGLVAALQSDGAPLDVLPGKAELRILIDEPWLKTALWLHWDAQHALLHLLLPIGDPIPAERLSAIESLIARINHRLVMPGFGLDDTNAVAYFRLCLPREEGLTVEQVRTLLRTAIGTVRDALPLFVDVLQGGVSPQEAILRAR